MREIGLGLTIAAAIVFLWFNNSFLPVLLLAVLFVFLFRFTGIKTPRIGVPGSKSMKGRTVVDFNQIGGQEPAKKELLEALEFVLKPRQLQAMGIRPLKGVMLVGPPGTGKTLLAKAAAGYTRSAFVSVAGSEFIEMYAGVGAQRVRQVFQQCRTLARREGKKSALLFIDEIDILGGKRGSHASHLEYDQTLNQLLVEMDGVGGGEVQILVIGATNRPEALDKALVRPGRFDRIVQVELPDLEGRLQILKLHLKNKPLHEEVCIEKVARETFGFSGAHLESLANEAAILALREGASRIKESHLVDAVEKVILGEKLDRKPEQEEIWRIAVHETGHALVSEAVRPGSVSTITITPRGKAMGYVRQNQDRDYYLYTREHFEQQIAMLLGGSASEKLVLGEMSTGSAGDFKQAMELARKIVASGLSSLGVVSVKDMPRGVLHRTLCQIIAAQEQWVGNHLSRQKEAIFEIARCLVEKEKVTGDFLRDLLSGFPRQVPPKIL